MNDTLQGGYNGGGSSTFAEDSDYGTGGGATDIRIEGYDLLNRVIVAGGGGGYGKYKSVINEGGYGGGLIGGGSNGGTEDYKIIECPPDITCWCGGGGGWANGDWGLGWGRTGGGGSGFVYNPSSKVPSNYKLNNNYFLSNSKTLNNNTGFISPFNFFEYGHRGNGFAKIKIIQRITCKIHFSFKISLVYLVVFIMK